MKTQINTNNAHTRFALALTLLIGFPLQTQAAEAVGVKATSEAKTMEHCHGMKEQKQKMLEVLKSQDAVLTDKISKMNSAPNDKKMALMAEVVTLMAEQRQAMNVQKAKMEEMMMQQMPMSMDEKAPDVKEKQK